MAQQRQDSTTDQLITVREIAREAGLLTSATWISHLLGEAEEAAPKPDLTEYTKLMDLAIKAGCYDAADAIKNARFGWR